MHDPPPNPPCRVAGLFVTVVGVSLEDAPSALLDTWGSGTVKTALGRYVNQL